MKTYAKLLMAALLGMVLSGCGGGGIAPPPPWQVISKGAVQQGDTAVITAVVWSERPVTAFEAGLGDTNASPGNMTVTNNNQASGLRKKYTMQAKIPADVSSTTASVQTWMFRIPFITERPGQKDKVDWEEITGTITIQPVNTGGSGGGGTGGGGSGGVPAVSKDTQIIVQMLPVWEATDNHVRAKYDVTDSDGLGTVMWGIVNGNGEVVALDSRGRQVGVLESDGPEGTFVRLNNGTITRARTTRAGMIFDTGQGTTTAAMIWNRVTIDPQRTWHVDLDIDYIYHGVSRSIGLRAVDSLSNPEAERTDAIANLPPA